MAGYTQVGSPVQAHILKQLQARATVFSRSQKSVEDLIALHSNTAWVSLRSSVNELTEAEISALEQSISVRESVIGSFEKASNFILLGGLREGWEPDPKAGISTEPGVVNPYKAYRNYEGLGIRPMPGITGVKVQSKNTYGTLMEAEVSFNVWTVEDLEMCELLYFRPGYTALLEWGHSLYIDSEGNLVRPSGEVSGMISNDNFFLSKTSTANTAIHPLNKEIENFRERKEGNYEGLFGFIRNFSFSFRPDGGYDCTVTIVSLGIILDSIKTAKTSDKTPMISVGKSKKEADLRKRKSVFHYCFYFLEEDAKPGKTNGKAKIQEGEAEEGGTLAKHLEDFDIYTVNVKVKGDKWRFSSETLQYISLRSFCMIVNNLNSIQNPYDKQPLTALKTPYISLEKGNKYLTFPEHFSADPTTAIPPKLPGASPYSDYVISKTNIHSYINNTVAEKAATEGGKDDVLNIMVSTFYLENVLNSMMDGAEEESTGVYDFVMNVLKGVSNALGGVNDLSLLYNHNTGHYSVVDLNSVRQLDADSIPVIDVTGLSTTISDLHISSKVSSAVASQVAIAAQGNSGNYKENVQAILEWNRGAVDRHMPIRDVSNTKKDTEQEERRVQFLEDLTKLWKSFNGEDLIDVYYDGPGFEDIRSEVRAEIQRLSKEHLLHTGQSPTGVVPVEISMTMLGIQGFTIGTTFRVNRGLLPAKYDNWAYVVTGVEHTIGQDHKWLTSIKAQFYPTRSFTPVKSTTSPYTAETSPSSSRAPVQGGVKNTTKMGPLTYNPNANIDNIPISPKVEQYDALLRKYFGNDERVIKEAKAVMQGESGGDSNAYRPESKNPGGGNDRGLFQINDKWHPATKEQNMMDPETNIAYAAKVYKQRGWRDWYAARKIGLVTR